MGRSSIVVPQGIADELAAIARERGKPLSSLTSEILLVFLRAEMQGYRPDNMLNQHEAIQFAKNTECMIVPMDLVRFCLENLYASKGVEMHKVSYDFGARCARHVAALQGNTLKTFVELTRGLLWDLTEFRLEEQSNEFILRACSPTYPRELMELIASFLNGYMHGVGFRTTRVDVAKGILQARYTRPWAVDQSVSAVG